MGFLTAYLVKSILASGLFYLYYQLVLKNKSFHIYNRFYLVGVVVISTLLPLVDVSWFNLHDKTELYHFVADATTRLQVSADESNAFSSWMLAGGLIISFILIVIVAFRIQWIYRVKKLYINTKKEGFTLIETDLKEAPFSFFTNLFWRVGLSMTDANGEKIFKHELAHMQQMHSLDKLLLQMITCIFWVNPFYWLIQKELNTVHEFLADAATIDDGDTESFANMLLYAHNNGSYLSPSHHFFNSQIKRRLIMISSSKTARYSWLRRALVLPVILVVVAAFSLSSEAQTKPQTTNPVVQTPPAPKKTTEVITVVGYPRNKKTTVPTPPASPESLKPVTVEGVKLEQKGETKKPL